MKIRDSTIEKLKEATRKCDKMQKLKNTVKEGWPQLKKNLPEEIKIYWNIKEEINYCGGLLFKGERIIILISFRKEILKKLYQVHQGIKYTIRLAKDTVYWPNINNHITETVNSCEACNIFKGAQQNLEMQSSEIPTKPWQIISMDIFEIYNKKILNNSRSLFRFFRN